MSILGLDSGVPSGFALGNSFRQRVIFDRISLVSSSYGYRRFTVTKGNWTQKIWFWNKIIYMVCMCMLCDSKSLVGKLLAIHIFHNFRVYFDHFAPQKHGAIQNLPRNILEQWLCPANSWSLHSLPRKRVTPLVQTWNIGKKTVSVLVRSFLLP